MTGPALPIQNYDFRFRVGAAIADQVAQHLFSLAPIPLSALGPFANSPGIYQLFLDGASVYIGQTVETVLNRVGGSHRAKIRGKKDANGQLLTDLRVTVRFVLIEDLTVIQISEDALIETMTRFALLTNAGASAVPVGSAAAAAAAVVAAGGALPALGSINLTAWNGSGFGSNVPGYNRRLQKPAKWALKYPADLTFLVEAGDAQPITPEALANQIAAGAPVWFGIPSREPDNMLPAFRVDHPFALPIPRAQLPYDQWLLVLEQGAHGVPRVLAPGWKVDRTHRQVHYVVNK